MNNTIKWPLSSEQMQAICEPYVKIVVVVLVDLKTW